MNVFIKYLSFALSFLIGFITFPISFLPSEIDEHFQIITGEYSENALTLNGNLSDVSTEGDITFNNDGSVSFSRKLKINLKNPFTDWFNYYGISYSSDAYVKGTLTYRTGVKEKSEDFFLEPSDSNKEFYSFIDNCLNNSKANELLSIEFCPLNKETVTFSIHGTAVFNRAVPDREIFIENDNYKLGIDLLWGGALSYLEDKNSDVEAVKVNNTVKVDSNASERYNTKAISRNVNLINRYDPGRLVQQSYYGTASGGYEPETFMDIVWAYNPVQGGNQYNESSKIVDLRITQNTLYIKCRPLDWAKPKEYITPSYMEATYKFEWNSVHASCRFVDYSGYDINVQTSQEIPAFYCIEPLNNFFYYAGDNPWNNEKLTTVDNLIFWPDAGYPHYYSSECWSGFRGEFEDSFGIGLYVPGETRFLTGVYERGTVKTSDPSVENATSYIAVTKDLLFRSYEPFEYEFYLTTGNPCEIRDNFKTINNNLG